MKTARDHSVNVDELARLLDERGCRIFGTGFVSEMFWYGLERAGLTDCVRGFIVSRCEKGESRHGKPVLPLSEAGLSEGETVCLAVHESAAEEILQALEGTGCRPLRVVPCLTELCYGRRLSASKPVSVRELLHRQDPGDLWLAVRYAAVRDCLTDRASFDKSGELYRRAIALHSSAETAERRLSALQALAEDMSANGWKDGRPLLIDERGRVIDGLHRLACAVFLGIEEVTADVYPASPAYERLLGEANRLPELYLAGNGFTENELEFLRAAWEEMLER